MRCFMHGSTIITRYCRLALPLLGGLCLAGAHLPALAANKVSVTVNPTTYYYEPTKRTFRVPPAATINPIKDVAIPTVQKLPNGALAQQISSGIEITALKGGQLRGPIYGRITAGAASLRSAAAGCFKSGRCNVALMAGALGLQALLDSVDWVMTEGGSVEKKSPVSDVFEGVPEDYAVSYTQNGTSNVGGGGCNSKWVCLGDGGSSGFYYICMPTYQGYSLTGYSPAGSYRSHCYYGGNAGYNNGPKSIPVSNTEINESISAYDPDPSDWRFLLPELDLGAPDVNAEITDAPRLQAPPVTTTIYDANGVPVEVQETNTWVDFAPKDNPGKQPAVDAVETEKTDTYNSNGEPTGSKTETKPQVAPPASGPIIPPAPPDIPTDCDLMPTLCKWFDWTQDGWEDPDEPDFEGLRQVSDLRDYDESVVIGPGLMACPEPLALYVPYLDVEVGISYQPFCDLADLLNPLLIALAYFGGAVLLVRSI